MTETRIYFEKLVSIFDALCKIEENEVIKFVSLKNQLFSTLTEINNYRLLAIDMPQQCLDISSNEDCLDLLEEQSILVVHLADQLCSQLIGKLWYGGELLYHLNRLTISSYHLPDHVQDEINLLEGEDNDGMRLRIRLKGTGDPHEAIKNLTEMNSELIQSTEGKFKAIDHDLYSSLLSQLKDRISNYRSYINQHYPKQADYFSFNKKLIKTYLCDEREDKIVCRVHSYEDKTDTSVYLAEHISDFAPRPPYNFEKIDKNLSSWCWFGIDKEDWNVPDNMFSYSTIHRELLKIYLAHVDERELVEFVKFFIRNQNLEVESNFNDFTYLTIDGVTTNEYLKVFHTQDINEEILKTTLDGLNKCQYGYHKQVMFTSKPDDIVIDYFEKNHVNIRHISELTYMHFDNHHSELIHLFIKSRLDLIQFDQPNEIHEGKLLIQELSKCPRGKTGWPKYEKIGADIFKFLFSDSFTQYIAETQASNSDDTLRRDLIVHNNYESSSTFWSRINTDFNAKLLIVEFKNYKDEFSYGTMHSTTKYLSNNTGNFILIFSRIGGQKELAQQQKDQLREGKLIISFDDKELIEMIEEKISGRNPLYRLELKYFSLLKK